MRVSRTVRFIALALLAVGVTTLAQDNIEALSRANSSPVERWGEALDGVDPAVNAATLSSEEARKVRDAQIAREHQAETLREKRMTLIWSAVAIVLGLTALLFYVFVRLVRSLAPIHRRTATPEEAKLFQDVYQGLTQMEERIERLESRLFARRGRGRSS